MQRTFARAGIPLALSQGMRPKPRLALGLPLPVGASALSELAVVEVCEPAMETGAALAALCAAAPEGLLVQSVSVSAERPRPHAVSAAYECLLDADSETMSLALAWFAEQDHVQWRRVTPKGERSLDLKEYVEDAWSAAEGGSTRLGFTVRHRQGGAARPQEFVDVVVQRAGVERVMRRLVRTRVTYRGLSPANGGLEMGER
jgi:radical SAM-linked protein